ncbi:hypothetical protein acdb102_39560 [Acidothermaceae bacterium B102]|nr:hypothetical protein acdb102_39560 [Acidothermaceae bacterium B102]
MSADGRRSEPEQLGQRGGAHRTVLEDRLGHPVTCPHIDAISQDGELSEVDGGFHNAYVT